MTDRLDLLELEPGGDDGNCGSGVLQDVADLCAGQRGIYRN